MKESEGNPPEPKKINWSATNIISIVLGLVIFWPVGLFLLVWVMIGRDAKEAGIMVEKEVRKLIAKVKNRIASPTGNRVFDEFQQTQHDRIVEIKNEMRNRANSFHSFKEERDRAAEEREFNDFMKSSSSTEASEAKPEPAAS